MKKLIQIFIAIMGVTTLMGCQTGYLIKSSYYQMKLLSKREKFEKALQDPKIDDETKRKIRLVQDTKDFAEAKLGLVHSDNYGSFVLLDDRYVTYVVTASRKDKLEGYKWSFPVVGSVPYKGFFKKADAEEEVSDLEKKNLDVAMRGVSAYSTLGWFNDPLLSSMTAYNDVDLVETIIHELTHATVYIKSNADFNERLATFVGTQGAQEYYLYKEGADSKHAEQAKLGALDSRVFGEFLTREIGRVEKFYEDNKKSPTLMLDREKVFADVRKHFEEECLPRLKTDEYKNFARGKINNAVLLNYKTYYQNLDIFQQAFEKLGRSWPAFLDYFKGLKKSKEPEQDLKAFLGQ